ncbi:MAG: glycoside hydrolase family 127 protein [Catenulispora sp.]|nr:glycoside hydrolase family 127 protein [Catenulispora sp.]
MSRPSSATSATGPVRLSAQANAALRPGIAPTVTAGFWHERRTTNARVGIPQGPKLLESAGNLHNLRLAAGQADGEFIGDFPFQDTDVYKWLEAASWQLAQNPADVDVDADPTDPADAADPTPDPESELADQVAQIVALIAAAQEPDGYLNTWFQTGKGQGRFTDLSWGHELYCAGHLIQAALAHHRATGRTELLDVARRFADHVDAMFGPPGSGSPLDTFDAHPEVETALVELYRETGERRYLDLAGYFVDRHGHGAHGGATYCQDRVPLREAETVEGHAVRQLYLLAAAADLAAETGEPALEQACIRLWHAMTTTKTHLTGGVGAHHEQEDFGAPFELPNERAYCETCAAIASVQFSWRMALLTGQARYSDLIERTLFNGFLAGVSLDGEGWLYVNPLQVRDGYVDAGSDQSSRRTAWFRCACCPPNVMRLLASLEHYLSSTDGQGLQIHQYATGRFQGEADGLPLSVTVDTSYPWNGRVTVTVHETPDTPWTLSLRIPQWCEQFTATYSGANPQTNTPLTELTDARPDNGWLRIERSWTVGDEIVLDLAMPARLVAADPRVDAVRGCVAIERGPLVYCLEQADHPGGGLDAVTIDPAAPLTVEERPDLLGGVTTVVASGHRRTPPPTDWWPYQAQGTPAAASYRSTPLDLIAIPYFAWANRETGSMRVWLPTEQH